MSTREEDSEVVELALELQGLSITVRGRPHQAASFVHLVTQSPELRQDSAPQEPSELGGYSTISASTTSSETRRSIQASFLPCPQHWVVSAGAALRSQSTRFTGGDRARRAWLAGQWAKAVLDGRVSSPNSTEAIELGNRFWCVVRCAHCPTPRIFTSSSAFFGAVRPLEGSDTISHAFPSETEAHIYLEAAGCPVTALN
eukprot:Skav208967  [mRNA]  locus=scaffold1134:67924:68523:+ [translate_table: standard]